MIILRILSFKERSLPDSELHFSKSTPSTLCSHQEKNSLHVKHKNKFDHGF